MFSKVTFASIFLLLWLRWLIATLPGYIHPDEFFQNPEITSSRIFNIQSFIPWEFQKEHALRSVISPFLTTGIPFWILKNWLPENQLPNSISLFAAERLGAFAWTLVIDFCTYRMCRHLSIKPAIPMILLATSQVTLAYHTRPFSNSFESVLLCLSLLTYLKFSKEATNKLAFFLGVFFSMGVFTRITFPLYALPIGIAFVYQAYRQSDNISQFTAFIFPLTLGIISFAALCIIIDSVFYGTLTFTVNGQPFKGVGHVFSTLFNPTSLASVRSYGDIVITPVNNFIYNSNVENLAQHGIHPRFTHFAVNLPMLYGPLAIFGLLYIPKALPKIMETDTNAHMFFVLLGVVASGLVGLSIIPHQEARFLCPLLVPLILIYSWRQNQFSISVYFWLLWIVFNIITTYIFGVVHQGGIVPAVSFLQRQTTGLHDCHLLNSGDLTCSLGKTNIETVQYSEYNMTTNMVFYKTYMPPQHLLAASESGSHHIRVLDFASRLNDAVTEMTKRPGVTLRRHDKTAAEIDFAKSKEMGYERTLFVVPSFVPLPKIQNRRYLLMATFSPHVSFDDMDKIMENASGDGALPAGQTSLNVFLLLSDKNDVSE